MGQRYLRQWSSREASKVKGLVAALKNIAETLDAGDPANRAKTWMLLSGGFELEPGKVLEDTLNEYATFGPGFDFRRTVQTSIIDVRRDMRELVELLRNCRCTVYTIDTLGLAGFDDGGSVGQYLPVVNERFMRRGLQDSLNALARDTGGQPFLGSSNFRSAFRNVLLDSRLRYVIGIDLEELGLQADAEPQWHELDVRVRQPDLDVRSREGFYWPRPADEDR